MAKTQVPTPYEIDKKCGQMNVGQAIALLKRGFAVGRLGWNGNGLWLRMQSPDLLSWMTLPYVYINYPASEERPAGLRVPWVPSQTDLLAEDWVCLKGTPDQPKSE